LNESLFIFHIHHLRFLKGVEEKYEVMNMKKLSLLLFRFLLSIAVFGVANRKEFLQPIYCCIVR